MPVKRVLMFPLLMGLFIISSGGLKAQEKSVLSYVPHTAGGYVYYDFLLFKKCGLYPKLKKTRLFPSIKKALNIDVDDIRDGVGIFFSESKRDILIVFRGRFNAVKPGTIPGGVTSVVNKDFTIYTATINHTPYCFSYPAKGLFLLARKKEHIEQYYKMMQAEVSSVYAEKKKWPLPPKDKILFAYLTNELADPSGGSYINFSIMALLKTFQLSVWGNDGTLEVSIVADMASKELAENISGSFPDLDKETNGMIKNTPSAFSVNDSVIRAQLTVAINKISLESLVFF